MNRADNYSQHSWIIWPVWPNGWVFVYELSGSGFESFCCHLTTNDLLFLLKTQKKTTTTLKHMTGGNTPNLVLRGMLGHFLKIQPLKKILEFQDWKKRLRSSYRKWNFKPEIKPMIEDLQDELYQLAIGIGDHEIKIVNFAESTTIFLRDITCVSRIQVFLKLYMKMHLARG